MKLLQLRETLEQISIGQIANQRVEPSSAKRIEIPAAFAIQQALQFEFQIKARLHYPDASYPQARRRPVDPRAP